jgi:hypothetical protein
MTKYFEELDGTQLEVRDVVGFEGIYGVTECGKAISLGRESLTKNGNTRLVSEKELKIREHWNGFKIVTFNQDGKVTVRHVARLVAIAWLEPPQPDEEMVSYKDGKRSNVHASNLYWVTRSVLFKGCKQTPKMSESKARRILKAWNGRSMNKASLQQFSKHFCVSMNTISLLVRGRTFKHLRRD